MLVHLRRLLSQTVVYGLGDAVTRVAALFLLPIYTRFLSPADYGRLAVITLFTTILALLLEFGQRTAFFRFYFDSDSLEARRRLTGTVFIFLLLAAVAISVPLILFFDRIATPFIQDVSLIALVRIALIGAVFDVGSTVPFAIFRAKQHAVQYASLSLARFLVGVVLSITAIVVLHRGVISLVFANLATSALFFLICVALTIREIEWTIELSLLKQLLRFGLPLVPASFAYWALNLSDRFFLQKYSDLSQVGLYSISYSIAGVLHLIMGWFNTAYAPYCYSIAQDADARTVYARVTIYSITVLTLVGLGLSLFAREALAVLTPAAYHGAARIVPFIVLSYLFFELYYLLSFGFDLTKKTGYAPFIIGAGAVINLALNLILIPPLGMLGAAIATVLSYMMLPIIEYPIVRRLYPIPYEWARFAKLLTISTVVYLIGMWLKTGKVWVDVGVGSVLILGWGGALYLARFFPQNELLVAQTTSYALLSFFRRGFHQMVSKKREQ